MKTFKWNLGLLIIRLGYKLRGSTEYPTNPTNIQKIGRYILGVGYEVRGQIPMKTYV